MGNQQSDMGMYQGAYPGGNLASNTPMGGQPQGMGMPKDAGYQNYPQQQGYPNAGQKPNVMYGAPLRSGMSYGDNPTGFAQPSGQPVNFVPGNQRPTFNDKSLTRSQGMLNEAMNTGMPMTGMTGGLNVGQEQPFMMGGNNINMVQNLPVSDYGYGLDYYDYDDMMYEPMQYSQPISYVEPMMAPIQYTQPTYTTKYVVAAPQQVSQVISQPVTMAAPRTIYTAAPTYAAAPQAVRYVVRQQPQYVSGGLTTIGGISGINGGLYASTGALPVGGVNSLYASTGAMPMATGMGGALYRSSGSWAGF